MKSQITYFKAPPSLTDISSLLSSFSEIKTLDMSAVTGEVECLYMLYKLNITTFVAPPTFDNIDYITDCKELKCLDMSAVAGEVKNLYMLYKLKGARFVVSPSFNNINDITDCEELKGLDCTCGKV